MTREMEAVRSKGGWRTRSWTSRGEPAGGSWPWLCPPCWRPLGGRLHGVAGSIRLYIPSLPIPSNTWLQGPGPPASRSQEWTACLAGLSLLALLCSIQVTDATTARCQAGVQHNGCTMTLSAPPVRPLLSASQAFWVLLLPPSASLSACNGHPALAMVACWTLHGDKSPLALSSLPEGVS